MTLKHRHFQFFVGILMEIQMNKNELEKVFADNNGVLKTSQLTALKIDSTDIKRLIENGVIEKIKTGYYRLLSNDPSEAAIIARLFPDGVLWSDTALFYYGYSDRTPMQWDIIISKNASRSRFKLDYPHVSPFFVTPARLSYGTTTIEIDGCIMNIFDRDRLICECLKYESGMDKETFNKAVQAYLADPKKNIKNLLTYAKRRKVTKRVHDVVGVWL
jgi:predicted transcriptional regulator of viral defense system